MTLFGAAIGFAILAFLVAIGLGRFISWIKIDNVKENNDG